MRSGSSVRRAPATSTTEVCSHGPCQRRGSRACVQTRPRAGRAQEPATSERRRRCSPAPTTQDGTHGSGRSCVVRPGWRCRPGGIFGQRAGVVDSKAGSRSRAWSTGRRSCTRRSVLRTSLAPPSSERRWQTASPRCPRARTAAPPAVRTAARRGTLTWYVIFLFNPLDCLFAQQKTDI